MSFKKATKSKARLRLAFIGPSGSGKTYSALAVAAGLATKTGAIAVLDTEHGSASLYADKFNFDVMEIETYAPATYVKAIQEADKAGYEVLVIDSLSHAWMGKGGALEMVDAAAARSKSGNTFGAWRDVTPEQQKMVEAILSARCHVIVTMRSKTEYVVENINGRSVPRKVGLAPVQRDGIEYEFDLVGDIDPSHRLVVTKSRIENLADAVIDKPGQPLAHQLLDWLGGIPAEPVVTRTVAEVPPPTESKTLAESFEFPPSRPPLVGAEVLKKMADLFKRSRQPVTYWDRWREEFKIGSSKEMDLDQATQVIHDLEAKISDLQFEGR